MNLASGQDGGVGRHTVCLLAQPKEGQQQFKLKNNQNWQKIELYASPTTKEIKKKHSSRPVGGAERTRHKAAAVIPSEVADCGTGQARLQLEDSTR